MKASSYSTIRVFSESRVKSPVKQATSLCPYGDACPMTTDQWYPGGHIGGLSPGTVDYTNLLQRQNKMYIMDLSTAMKVPVSTVKFNRHTLRKRYGWRPYHQNFIPEKVNGDSN